MVMKTIIFFGTVILLIIGSFTQEKKLPIEGTWKMVYGKWFFLGTTYPAQIKGDQIKMLSKKHFTFVGHFEADTLTGDNYGWGTYTLNGNKYEELEVLSGDKSSIGKSVRILVEVKNDTLIQKWPADENWKLEEKYSVEKYVRAE
jgi:hypothetical protein